MPHHMTMIPAREDGTPFDDTVVKAAVFVALRAPLVNETVDSAYDDFVCAPDRSPAEYAALIEIAGRAMRKAAELRKMSAGTTSIGTGALAFDTSDEIGAK